MTNELVEIRRKLPVVDDGWVRRFLAAPDRVDEAVALYTEMGFEVRVDRPSPSTFNDECEACSEAMCETYFVIYTRKKDGGSA